MQSESLKDLATKLRLVRVLGVEDRVKFMLGGVVLFDSKNGDPRDDKVLVEVMREAAVTNSQSDSDDEDNTGV